jgi:hypothetical protein
MVCYLFIFSHLHPVSSCSLVVHRVRPTGRLHILRRQQLLPDATLRHTWSMHHRWQGFNSGRVHVLITCSTSWRFDDPFLFPPDLSQGSSWHEIWIGYVLLLCWIKFGRWISIRSWIRKGPIPAFPVVTSYFYLISSFSRFQFCRCIVESLHCLLLHF